MKRITRSKYCANYSYVAYNAFERDCFFQFWHVFDLLKLFSKYTAKSKIIIHTPDQMYVRNSEFSELKYLHILKANISAKNEQYPSLYAFFIRCGMKYDIIQSIHKKKIYCEHLEYTCCTLYENNGPNP